MSDVPTYTELLKRVEALDELDEAGAHDRFDDLRTALEPILGEQETEDSPQVIDAAFKALRALAKALEVDW